MTRNQIVAVGGFAVFAVVAVVVTLQSPKVAEALAAADSGLADPQVATECARVRATLAIKGLTEEDVVRILAQQRKFAAD
jgi:hypothetical protein